MAKTRPIKQNRTTLEERLDDLERPGVLVRPEAPREPLEPAGHRAGALKRFLAERGR